MDDDSIRSKMVRVVDLVSTDVGSIRGARATPAIVEEIDVSAYGGAQKLKINELATISAGDAQTIVIDPWDKSIIGEIKKAILSANVGLNPNIDGEIIRISLPPMTTEDRENYVRLLGKKLENGKVMVRQIRGDIMHDIKVKFESKDLSEDEKFSLEKRLQELTDEYTDKIDKLGETKKRELMQV